MKDEHDNAAETSESSGTLADAIADHLALKREHGADPGAVEDELEEALSPPGRDEPLPEVPDDDPAPTASDQADESNTVAPDTVAPETVEPDTVEPRAAEPSPAEAAEPEPTASEPPAPEPVREAEPPAPEQSAPEPPAPEEPKPGEITGTLEFEFGEEQSAEAEQEASQSDPLEDVPDFFEETPEHDKLWFDEAPPRKFDF